MRSSPREKVNQDAGADAARSALEPSDRHLGLENPDPRYPPGVKQQRHLVTSRRYTSPTPPENQPTGGCPHGYADWCLAREIVKTVKTEGFEKFCINFFSVKLYLESD